MGIEFSFGLSFVGELVLQIYKSAPITNPMPLYPHVVAAASLIRIPLFVILKPFTKIYRYILTLVKIEI